MKILGREACLLMQTKSTIHETVRCGLEVTTNARKGIMKWAKDEHAFFRMQDAFNVHIEKRPQNRHGNMSFSIFFDNETNEILTKQLNDRVAVMECVYKNEGFLATGFHVRGRKEPVRTNRRYPVKLKFTVGRGSVAQMPIELYTALRELPIAEERSAYVEKRIASWEGYLRIQEINADVEDVTASFSQPSFNEDFSKLRLHCSGLEGKDWHTIKGFSAKITGLGQDIGNVLNANRSKKMIEIELNPRYKEMARRSEWQPKSFKEVVFSNFAELSQVRRLRKGFKDLQDGLAANANLEKVLFEERPVVRISKEKKELVFHNQLNEFQREAVTGAMTSNDLYVIQGPPGTGKTTVISEICHQNVKAGLRTLVASQANLAVDNALGRLLSHQDIRILRYGRTDSIEEEGKKFIEENVAENWKNQTVHAVNEQLLSHEVRTKKLADELTTCKEQLKTSRAELILLEEKVTKKEQAKVDHLALSNKHTKLTNQMAILTTEQAELNRNQEKIKMSVETLSKEINRLEQLLESEALRTEEVLEMDNLAEEIENLRIYINYRETIAQQSEMKTVLTSLQQKMAAKQLKIDAQEQFLEETLTILKLDVLERRLADFDIIPPSSILQKIDTLNHLIREIKSMMSDDQYSEWQKLNTRLLKAIDMTEELLRNSGAFIQTPPRTAERKYHSAKEINGLIDRIGRFLVDPVTKKVLETRNYSAEKYDTHEKIAIALDMLQKQRNHVQIQGGNIDKQQQMIQNSKDGFTIIKREIIGFVNQSILALTRDITAMEQEMNELEIQHSHCREVRETLQAQLGNMDDKLDIITAQEQLNTKEKMLANYLKKKASLEQFVIELGNHKNDKEVAQKQLEENSITLHQLVADIETLSNVCIENEKELSTLLEVLSEKPEEQHEILLATYDALSKRVEEIHIEKERLPITQELQQEWATLLSEANEYDLDEIRKLYVEHANVIGTTCVASARRDFMEEYPTFDVVIIDEVSKATPPELLLPMLKGKKIILVGDHHQLPPLMGQETLEELLEESASPAEKRELEKLLKESLFERLFRTLPKQNKTMLGIQYRMHESIMETITPFYEEGNYRLQCGLTDSDAMRDHLIDSQYIKREDHLLWFDMPNEPKYFEEQVKGGTSRYNQGELLKVKDLLIDLEAATIRAKQEGRMKQEDKKSVGVISFYGEQVKRIDRLIGQDLNPQHLHCRTGSVDKFQGMEMDIIILSFVRNHQHKGGDIGFAKDYRRLNVALSRARELLIIVGSSEMFTKRTRDANVRDMYGRLLENIKMKNGFKDLVEVKL